MKALFILIGLCVLANASQSQTNLVFTNDAAIGNSNWFPAMHFSYGDKNRIEVNAGDVNRLIIWNSITNINYFIWVPRPGIQWNLSSFLHLTLMATNGIIIPPTAQGKLFTIEPKRDTKFMVVAGTSDWKIPKLTDLFKFPSNGEYVLEARIWWANPKDHLLLSDPVRLKVIKRNVSSTNSPLQK